MTFLEEEELAALRHRFITSVRRNLHICLVTHSHQVNIHFSRCFIRIKEFESLESMFVNNAKFYEYSIRKFLRVYTCASTFT